jgi:MraZ protein
MNSLIGEYECKLDAKGRFLMPSNLRKQLPEELQGEFVVNKGLDPCLVLFPIPVWEAELARLKAKNPYVKKNRAFLRVFLNGAMKLALDGSSRMLLPKRLMEYAKLEKEMVLVAQIDRVEIWDKASYEAIMDDPGFELDDLAEEVMGEGDE